VTIELIGCSAPYVEAIEQRIHDRFGAEVDHADVVMVLCGTEGRWALLDDEIATNSRVVVAVLPELLLEDYIRALSAGASGVVYVDTSSAITVDVISAAVNGEVVLPLQAAHNMAVLAKRLKPSTDLTPPPRKSNFFGPWPLAARSWNWQERHTSASGPSADTSRASTSSSAFRIEPRPSPQLHGST
jgi:hypothetical protein